MRWFINFLNPLLLLLLTSYAAWNAFWEGQRWNFAKETEIKGNCHVSTKQCMQLSVTFLLLQDVTIPLCEWVIVLATTGCHGYHFERERERETLLCGYALRTKTQLYFRQCVLCVRKEQRLKKQFHVEHIIQRSTNRWEHSDRWD
jgi:hypothetical protein